MLRVLSSAGSERLPYKQRVGGSNPSAPTFSESSVLLVRAALLLLSSPYALRCRSSSTLTTALRHPCLHSLHEVIVPFFFLTAVFPYLTLSLCPAFYSFSTPLLLLPPVNVCRLSIHVAPLAACGSLFCSLSPSPSVAAVSFFSFHPRLPLSLFLSPSTHASPIVG